MRRRLSRNWAYFLTPTLNVITGQNRERRRSELFFHILTRNQTSRFQFRFKNFELTREVLVRSKMNPQLCIFFLESSRWPCFRPTCLRIPLLIVFSSFLSSLFCLFSFSSSSIFCFFRHLPNRTKSSTFDFLAPLFSLAVALLRAFFLKIWIKIQ